YADHPHVHPFPTRRSSDLTVYVENSAGVGSGFSDDEYTKAGAKMLKTAEEVFSIAEMIMKVKEPIEQEYKLIKKDQLVFTYFHRSEEHTSELQSRENLVCR